VTRAAGSREPCAIVGQCIHTRACVSACTHTQVCVLVHTRAHTHTHTFARAHTVLHTNKRAHRQTHTHTHTHAHTSEIQYRSSICVRMHLLDNFFTLYKHTQTHTSTQKGSIDAQTWYADRGESHWQHTSNTLATQRKHRRADVVCTHKGTHKGTHTQRHTQMHTQRNTQRRPVK
jgi:hypothetical protein